MVSSGNMDTVLQPASTAATPLSAMAEAFEDLAKLLKERKNGSTDQQALKLVTFCNACSFVSVLFNSLGLAFKFAELEYVAKVWFPLLALILFIGI